MSANGWVVAFSAAVHCGKHGSKSVGEMSFFVPYAFKKEQMRKPGSHLHPRKI